MAAALPSILLCAFGVAGLIIEIHQQWPERGHSKSWILIASEISSIIFLLMQAALLSARRLPILKYPGLIPRLWAIVAANFSYSLVLLPKAGYSDVISAISSAVLVVGTIGAAFTLFHLRRGFAILPQARALAITGPYRIIRHPLYLFEQISMFGVSLQYLQPWAFGIAIVGFALQFPRMRFEEEIMAEAYPAYREYTVHTPKIVPWLY